MSKITQNDEKPGDAARKLAEARRLIKVLASCKRSYDSALREGDALQAIGAAVSAAREEGARAALTCGGPLNENNHGDAIYCEECYERAREEALEEAARVAEGTEGDPSQGKRGVDLDTSKWQSRDYWHGRGVAADAIRALMRRKG